MHTAACRWCAGGGTVDSEPTANLKKPLGQYLRDHFYITTSGNFHTPTLNNVIEEMGIDRVMFSVDYPYESMPEGARWFDGCPLEGQARLKVARLNAQRLLHLNVP